MEVCPVSPPTGGFEESGVKGKAAEAGFLTALLAMLSSGGVQEASAGESSCAETVMGGGPEGQTEVAAVASLDPRAAVVRVCEGEPSGSELAVGAQGPIAEGWEGRPIANGSSAEAEEGVEDSEQIPQLHPRMRTEAPVSGVQAGTLVGLPQNAGREIVLEVSQAHFATEGAEGSGKELALGLPGPAQAEAPPYGRSEVQADPSEGEAREPADIRERVEESFRTRSERLWQHWLQARQGNGGRFEANSGGGEPRGVALEDTPRSPEFGAEKGAANRISHEIPVLSPTPAEEPESGKRPETSDGNGIHRAPPAETPRESGAPHVESTQSRGVARSAHTPPVQQVAREVHLAVARGGDRVTVRLEPESLGKVQVVLTRDGAGITAHFRVENPQTHQALVGDAPMLRQVLEAKGVPLVQVSVELEDRGDGGRRDWDQARARSRRGDTGPEVEGVEEVLFRPATWRPWGFDARI